MEENKLARHTEKLWASLLYYDCQHQVITGLIRGRGWEFFFLTTMSRLALEPTQPPSQWVPVTLSPGVKQPGREADAHPQLVLRQ
jgi:hypothetical protein